MICLSKHLKGTACPLVPQVSNIVIITHQGHIKQILPSVASLWRQDVKPAMHSLGSSGSKGGEDPGKLKYLITEQGQEGWQAYLQQLNLAPRAIHHNSGYLPSIFAELSVQPANQPYPKSKILNGRKQLETFLVLHSGVTKCEARQVHNWGTRT